MPTPLRRNRDFVLLQLGQVFSNLGTELTLIAYPLLVLSLTHSPAKAGIVGFARFFPYVLFVIPAGVAVDRANRKRLMILCDIGRALALGWIVIALAGGWLSFAQVIVVAFIEGTLLAFFNLAELGAIGQVVRTEQLGEAVSVEQARVFGTTLVGPPVGGALFGFGRALPFLGDAVSYALSVVSLAFMRTPFQEQRTEPSANWRAEVAEGFRWLWRNAFLRTCALIFSGTNLAWNALLLVIIVAGRRQGLSPAAIGALTTAVGAGGLVGSLLSPRIQRRLGMRNVLVASGWAPLAMLLYVAWGNVYVLAAAGVPAALLAPSANAMVVGYRVAATPDRLRGRVNSVARLIAQLGSPVGPLVAGLLLQSISGQATVAAIVAWMALLATWTTLSPAIRAAPSLADVVKPEPISETGPVPVG